MRSPQTASSNGCQYNEHDDLSYVHPTSTISAITSGAPFHASKGYSAQKEESIERYPKAAPVSKTRSTDRLSFKPTGIIILRSAGSTLKYALRDSVSVWHAIDSIETQQHIIPKITKGRSIMKQTVRRRKTRHIPRPSGLMPQETFCLIFRIFFIQQLLCIVYVRFVSPGTDENPFTLSNRQFIPHCQPAGRPDRPPFRNRNRVRHRSATICRAIRNRCGPGSLASSGAIALRAYRA